MTLDLPADLREAVAARDVARSAHAAAAVAAEKLAAELAAAQRNLVDCSRTVLAHVRTVISEEIATKGAHLRELESVSTPLRMELAAASLLFIPTGGDPPNAAIAIDQETRVTIRTPPKFDVTTMNTPAYGRGLRVLAAYAAWAKALGDDADATLAAIDE